MSAISNIEDHLRRNAFLIQKAMGGSTYRDLIRARRAFQLRDGRSIHAEIVVSETKTRGTADVCRMESSVYLIHYQGSKKSARYEYFAQGMSGTCVNSDYCVSGSDLSVLEPEMISIIDRTIELGLTKQKSHEGCCDEWPRLSRLDSAKLLRRQTDEIITKRNVLRQAGE